jgi:ribokinase
VARVGDDLFGPATIANFRERGIEAGHVWVTPGVSSGVAPIFVDAAGQNRILVVKGANDRLVPADVDAAADLLRAADCLVLQLEIPLQTVYHALQLARREGIRTILNPAPGQALDLEELKQVDYLIPNESEAEAISGMPVRNIEEARACAASLAQRGAPKVIVTLGAGGALLADSQRVRHFPPHKVNPLDTTGAGDAFIGSFAASLARGLDEGEAIERANVYAALSTLAVGTQSSFVTAERFDAVWEERSQPSQATGARTPSL